MRLVRLCDLVVCQVYLFGSILELKGETGYDMVDGSWAESAVQWKTLGFIWYQWDIYDVHFSNKSVKSVAIFHQLFQQKKRFLTIISMFIGINRN